MEEKKKIVFIVEDDIFLVKAYRMKFEEEGYEVWVTGDGNEAMSYLTDRQPPSLVLLDLMLPGISGFEVLTAIRKNEHWKNVPVIIVSNLGQPEDLEKGKELGAQDYVVKANVRIADVIEKVKKYL